MTRVGCPICRLRFTAATTASLVACPECGGRPQVIAGAADLLGFRLFVLEDIASELPEAAAVSIPLPDPGDHR